MRKESYKYLEWTIICTTKNYYECSIKDTIVTMNHLLLAITRNKYSYQYIMCNRFLYTKIYDSDFMMSYLGNIFLTFGIVLVGSIPCMTRYNVHKHKLVTQAPQAGDILRLYPLTENKIILSFPLARQKGKGNFYRRFT